MKRAKLRQLIVKGMSSIRPKYCSFYNTNVINNSLERVTENTVVFVIFGT